MPSSRALFTRTRLLRAMVLLCLCGASLLALPASATSGPPHPQSADPNVDSFFAGANSITGLTLAEKFQLMHGASVPAGDPYLLGQAGNIPGIPRLGIPTQHETDGPTGIRLSGARTTALPIPVSLASTFSPDLAGQYGTVLGTDAHTTGMDIVYGPMMNIVRVPTAGRNFETLGEDPTLMVKLVPSEVNGIQDQGVMAQAKHFAENNQEYNRSGINVVVGDQTLHQIELPGFESAVNAGTASIMCSYNRVNGDYACENNHLLTDILRLQWGYPGFVGSDYGAAQTGPNVAPSGTQTAVNGQSDLEAGLDEEMPSGNHYGALYTAMQNSFNGDQVFYNQEIPYVDQAVYSILFEMDKYHLLPPNGPDPAFIPSKQDPATIQSTITTLAGSPSAPEALVAKNIATQGAVLLKNSTGLLPLSSSALDTPGSIAVIGHPAEYPLIGGGGSSRVIPAYFANLLNILNQRANGGTAAGVTYQEGTDLDGILVPSTALGSTNDALAQPGLTRTQLLCGGTGQPVCADPQVDPQVNYTGANTLPAGTQWTWTGTITLPTPILPTNNILKVEYTGGTVALQLDGVNQSSGGGGFGGELMSTGNQTGAYLTINQYSSTAQVNVSGKHTITLTATPAAATPMQIRFNWTNAATVQTKLNAAVAAAAAAQTVIVYGYDEGTEGSDRGTPSSPNLALPDSQGSQDALITAIASANPHTIVVLNTGDPVTMPWLNKVPSVLEMWYPGQEGSNATADLLFGAANPGGKLPVTFPKSWADTPMAADPTRYPSCATARGYPPPCTQNYSEGIFMGYRWYDQQNITPLFPFGYGLSYTQFAYSQVHTIAGVDGFDVSFTVKNTGTVSGTDVPQVYLGGSAANVPAGIQIAKKQLVGFQRLTLAAGATQQVTIHVSTRDMSYWDTNQQTWVQTTGARQVFVSTSASDSDIKLTGETPVTYNAAHYSILTFGNLTLSKSGSTVAGPVAVGGDATIKSAHLGNKKVAQDELVVQGNLSCTSTTIYGNVKYSGTLSNKNCKVVNGTTTQVTPALDVASEQGWAQGISTTWAQLAMNGTVNYVAGTLVLAGTDPAQDVFTVAGSNLFSARHINISAPAGSTVIINVTGTDAAGTAASGTNDALQSAVFKLKGVDKQHIVWNFSQAQTLTLKGTVQGTVWAPSANVTANAVDVYGSVVAQTLTGKGTFRDAQFQAYPYLIRPHS